MSTKKEIVQGVESSLNTIVDLFKRQSKGNSKKAREWLKDLQGKLETKLPKDLLKSLTKPKPRESPYISRTTYRGSGELRDCLWIGMAHKKFEDPHHGVQFEFGIDKDGIRFNGVWIQGKDYTREAREARKVAKASAEENIEGFTESLRGLGKEFYVKFGISKWKYLSATEITRQKTQELIEKISDTECYIHIGKEIKDKEAWESIDKLAEEIAYTFERLWDIYSRLIGSAKRTGEIHSTIKHLERRGKESILKIKEPTFYGNTSQRVYPRAYKRIPKHDKLREKLKYRLEELKFKPKETESSSGKTDLYAEKANMGYIFEVKVIGKGTPSELYEGVGQLYWYQFDIGRKLKTKDFRLVLFTNKQPPQEVIDFLEEDRGIICLWTTRNKFDSGNLATKYPYLRDFSNIKKLIKKESKK